MKADIMMVQAPHERTDDLEPVPRLRLHGAVESRTASAGAGSDAHLEAPLLTAAQVAAILGVSAKRVYELGIPAVHISERALRWRPAAVSSWITDHEEPR